MWPRLTWMLVVVLMLAASLAQAAPSGGVP